jgi:ubiquinone/menaquinone biosynthesis C-methylase UbiE
MKVTRGEGLLEGLLARKRAVKANELLKQVEKGIILDIGCGSYPYFLLSAPFDIKHGIDYSLTTTKIKNLKLEKRNVAGKPLSFKDNHFDAITMLAVFEHIEHDKLKDVLREIRRVLKKNGVFIITTPAPWSDKLLHQMAKIGLISSEEIHEHKHNLSHKKIKDYLVETGFLKDKIKNGYFEGFMNMWFRAEK